jgi:anti-sigma factor RsiW
MPDKPSKAEIDAIHEELVAYLDGELDTKEVQRVERRLADDAEYRARLNALQRAWDLLDNLPRASVDESFTQSTVKLVAVNAEEEARKNKSKSKVWQGVVGIVGAAAAVAAAWGGYVWVMGNLSRPNEELVQDLPIIENVDLYRHAQSIEFLHDLDREGLFAQEVEDAL